MDKTGTLYQVSKDSYELQLEKKNIIDIKPPELKPDLNGKPIDEIKKILFPKSPVAPGYDKGINPYTLGYTQDHTANIYDSPLLDINVPILRTVANVEVLDYFWNGEFHWYGKYEEFVMTLLSYTDGDAKGQTHVLKPIEMSGNKLTGLGTKENNKMHIGWKDVEIQHNRRDAITIDVKETTVDPGESEIDLPGGREEVTITINNSWSISVTRGSLYRYSTAWNYGKGFLLTIIFFDPINGSYVAGFHGCINNGMPAIYIPIPNRGSLTRFRYDSNNTIYYTSSDVVGKMGWNEALTAVGCERLNTLLSFGFVDRETLGAMLPFYEGYLNYKVDDTTTEMLNKNFRLNNGGVNNGSYKIKSRTNNLNQYESLIARVFISAL